MRKILDLFTNDAEPNQKKSKDKCDHDWSDPKKRVWSWGGIRITEEDQRPFMKMGTTTERACRECGKIDVVDEEEKRLYLSIEEIEEVEDGTE